MKILKQFSVAVAGLLVLTLAACSGPSGSLLEKVPASTDVVAVIDADAILKSADIATDGNKIVLPEYIQKFVSPHDMERNAAILDNAGAVDLSQIVITVNFESGRPAILFGLKDKDAFVGLLTDKGYEDFGENSDYHLYSKYNDYIVIADNYAVVLSCDYDDEDFDAFDTVDAMLAQAKEESIASSSKGKNLTGHTAAFVARMPEEILNSPEFRQLRALNLPEAYFKSTFAGYADLSTDAVKGHLEVLDSDGKALNMYELGPEDLRVKPTKISKKALRFIGENEVFVAAASIKDVPWDKFFEFYSSLMPGTQERMILTAIEPYISAIDGTVAFSAGPINGLEFAKNLRDVNRNPLKYFSMTILVEMKDDKASSTLRQLKTLASGFGVPATGSDTDFSISLGEFGVYLKAEDGTLVVSTRPIATDGLDNSTVDSFAWGDWYSGIGVAIDNKSLSLSDFHIEDYEFSLSGYMNSTNAVDGELEFKGGKGNGLIERIIRTLVTAESVE